ncbi:MAG: PAS domain S-box protein [Desulfobulbaceae bacterium]|nr:PAS domain S-box protein [Desulfobulbaceae bacterium]
MSIDPVILKAFNITPASIVIINKQGIIEFFNPSAEKMFHYKSDEVFGKNISMLMPDPTRSKHSQYLQRYLNTSKPHVIGKGREDEARCKDGTTIFIHLSVDEIFFDHQRHFIAVIVDMSKTQSLIKQLALSDERSSLSQRFAQIGYWDWTIHSGDLYWSERIAPMFGYEFGDVKTSYENFLKAIHPEDREMVTEAVNDCVANEKKYDIEHRVIWSDGTIRWLLERGDVIRDDAGVPLRMLGVVQDITARKKLEQDIIHAKEAAEKGTQTKSAFLANMSHEIRTPMNAVVGLTEVVLETELDDNQRDHLNTVCNSAKSLLALLNDILDISKLESGKLGLEQTTFHLPRLLKGVIQTLDITSREKAIKLNLSIHEDLFRCVIGDPSRLRQILINLIGNAIKFTSKGSVTVKAEPFNNHFIHFSVQDTGIGMTNDQILKIFDPFTQADNSTARRYGGTGLGTTISKQLVELMNGEIWADSEIGAGSTFHFTAGFNVPDCAADCTTDCPAHIQPGEFPLPKPKRHFKVLLVEDIEANVTLATIRLKQQGHDVTVAWDGLQAVEYFKEEQYDIILMDVQMPEMDGMEATRIIRELQTDGHIPIIAMTASVMAEDLILCRQAGMDDIVGKPVDFAQLFAAMEKHIPPEVGTPADQININLATNKKFTLRDIHGVNIEKGIKTWLDAEKYSQSLIGFANKYGDCEEKFQTMLNKKEHDKAYHLAHALKGVAGNLAADRIYQLAKDIDLDLKSGKTNNALLNIELLGKEIQRTIIDIKKIDLPTQKIGIKPSQPDLQKTREILNNILQNLDSDNPDLVLPMIDLLTDHLEETSLAPLREHIEEFDFDEAKNHVQLMLREI